ncbi:family 1 encapsulin nanocompartment shell protein [Curtobacterium sp. ISL-83]|uniref:family 1 encapsulin nanocompartment shell protein n=1 Tax=Curtobacterium sp. ISL-83 TaxID=2819145 RepID=UPI001BE61E3C|nr:family 1 encapsulin nanocompartment shell protein [Curtobacterium sp. ISL-83]MBT2503637.1 bacteriocin family protein [Curtobacterium sp. ISL-83]
MDHLLRHLAPFDPAAWEMLDQEARARLTTALSARRIVDFDGPLGWQRSSVDLGRTEPVSATVTGIAARRRRVLPLAEVRADFTIPLAELVDFSRGADDVDVSTLDAAALTVAAFENRVVFEGWDAAGIVGVVPSSTHQGQDHDGTPASFRMAVTAAVASLRSAGVAGPYVLAAGPEDWVDIVQTEDAGSSLLGQLEAILGGRVEWTPGISGSVVLSARGGDFSLTVGQDLALGYTAHDAQDVHLYVEESLTFRVVTPEAAVPLRTLL